MVKRKKHDKDKYYNLARQQGYRARSAFKLIQLNKKYDFLSTAKVCIDLCAAPGGWCQVAAKYMPASSIIIGIDLLPIRPIRGVKTFQCDITTAKCRQIIKQETQSWQVDVVLCDGAPNVGAEYTKDAYVQNELALVALKLAVDVMGRGATFVSKVFRSQDYNALLWVFKQFFKKVSATKPLSSRNESAEIFVVCEQYLAPHSIDPKLFDPKFVFDQLDAQEKNITIFHPKFGVQKRHREGYDEALGQTLTNECSVSQFLDSSDPIRLLTDTTAIRFRPEDDVYREHPETNDEVVLCLKDLKVLGKSDFKMLLKWRLKMLKYKEELLKAQAPPEDDEHEQEALAAQAAAQAAAKEPETALTEEEKNVLIREELAQLRASQLAKKKREKKKEREQKRKLRIRQALGMNEQGVDVADGAESAFSLKELGLSKAQVDLLENAGPLSDDDEDRDGRPDSDTDLEFESDDDEYAEVLEAQMEKLYDEYLSRKGDAAKTKKAAKRSKIAKRAIAGEALTQDAEMYDGDVEAYHKMIQAEASSDDNDDDEEDTSGKLAVPLRFTEKPNAAVSRWFSDNKLFAGVEDDAEVDPDDQPSASGRGRKSSALYEMPKTDKQIRKEKRKAAKERQERRELKKQKKDEEQYEMEYGSEFTTVAAPDAEADDVDMDDDETGGPRGGVDADEDGDGKRVSEEMKALIRSGMGAALKHGRGNAGSGSDAKDIEVVAADNDDSALPPVMDDRKFDSDHEDYDEEDRARTLALAHMMVRKTAAKDMVDASYNRYAWNDSAELPDWFVDDEEKHYRPQVPIPKKLFEQMKERFMALATKPIKKVAEARGRKQRQQLKKLKAAKKKAADIANLPDMSTREKLKAIDRAMKGAKLKKEQKVYVISRRGGRTTTAQSAGKKPSGKVKLVDARMRKDKRNADIKAKRGSKKKR